MSMFTIYEKDLAALEKFYAEYERVFPGVRSKRVRDYMAMIAAEIDKRKQESEKAHVHQS